MTYLIRVLTAERWNFEYSETDKPFKANPLGDLRTDHDNLSVFELDKKKTNLNDILLGFALKKYSVSTLQYVELDPKEISKLGFDVVNAKEEGNTLIQAANEAHMNIQIRSADKLVELAKHIYTKTENIQTVKRKEIKKLIEDSLTSGTLTSDDLNCGLKKVFKNS